MKEQRDRFLLPLLAFCLFAAVPILSAERIRLPAGAPVFAEASANARILGKIRDEYTFTTAEKPVRVWFAHHPLVQYADFYPVSLEGQAGYVSPDILPDGSGNALFFRVVKDAPLPGRMLLPGAIGLLFFLLYRLCRRPKTGAIAERQLGNLGSRIEPRSRWEYYAAIAVLVRVALLSYVVCMSGNVLCNPADEPGYFAVGYDILRGNFAGPWAYPVGHGLLLMLPAIVLSGAESYMDLAIPLSWFGGFVLGPLAMILAFKILLALKIPLKIVFGSVLAWAVLPFFIHHAPDWSKLIFYSFAGLPGTGHTYRFRYYMELIGAGFNGMSDIGSTVLVFTVLFLALTLTAKWRNLALISALFGVSCLVRLNNIFFAPALGFLLIVKYLPQIRDRKSLLAFLGIGSAAYLAVVGIQFAVNAGQFGSPWIWPYSLHALDCPPQSRPAAGFTWATLMKLSNLRYLLESNLAVMSCGIAGLLMMHDRFQRAVLGLWSIPVILFFCGYSHTFCDPVRFILSSFIPLLAAAALLFAEQRQRFLTGCLIALGLIALHSGVVLAILLALLLLRSVADAAAEILKTAAQNGSGKTDDVRIETQHGEKQNADG